LHINLHRYRQYLDTLKQSLKYVYKHIYIYIYISIWMDIYIGHRNGSARAALTQDSKLRGAAAERISIVCRCEMWAVSFRELTSARFNSVRLCAHPRESAMACTCWMRTYTCTILQDGTSHTMERKPRSRTSNRSAIWGKRIDRVDASFVAPRTLKLRLNYRTRVHVMCVRVRACV